jgi:uncharacterized RDD family membrane protein YckC
MTNDKKNAKKPKVSVHESTAMPSGTFVSLRRDKLVINKESKEEELTLVETSYKPRTRNSLYAELEKEEKLMTDEDYYDFAPFPQRGIAFLIDCVFIFFLIEVAIFLRPLLFKIIYHFLDNYHLELWFSDAILMQTLLYAESFLMLFFMVVIPLAFFNTSLGKKITGLRVRGDDKYTLSITQAFQRELFYKPLGLACLVGVVLPFFDKKKKSLHDKITRTFVIKD